MLDLNYVYKYPNKLDKIAPFLGFSVHNSRMIDLSCARCGS